MACATFRQGVCLFGMPSLRRLAETAAADRLVTRDEVQGLLTKAQGDGKVTAYEKLQLRSALRVHGDVFAADAKALLESVVGTVAPKAPSGTSPAAQPLTQSAALRPVFLAADGSFALEPDGKPATHGAERGEALFRAAEVVDDARVGQNVFAALPLRSREQIFAQLAAPLAGTVQGLDARQALQAKASAGTVLLHLLEASPEAALRAQLLTAYDALVQGCGDKRLAESLAFHLSNSAATSDASVKGVADRLMATVAPVSPPYEKWFKDGNDTVKLDWQVGSEFIDGFKRRLANDGWTEASAGSGVFTKSFADDKHGTTKFEVRVRLGGTNLLEKLNDPTVHILGYDGHASWGRNQVGSIRRGPEVADGGDGKLFLSNLCVGKSQIDAMKERYPNLQYTTTYGSSSVDTDLDGLAELISKRAPWTEITPFLDRVDGEWDRNNFVTPASTLVRERVLDRDNDGQADYLDKHFSVSTFSVPVDTQREFTPVKQDRHASLLDGTKVNIAAQVLNTVSEFSGILKLVNKHSKVVAAGWFEPTLGETDVVRFTKVKGKSGQDEWHLSVNARCSHMSEEALRATCVYELNRWLQRSGEQKLDPVDRKLAGVIGFAQSLDVDEGWRDEEIFRAFLTRYNLPNIDRSVIARLLNAEHHDYAGSAAMVAALKKELSAEQLSALARPEVGEPVRLV